MKINTRVQLQILTLIIFSISMVLLVSQNWKIAIGVLLFGWAMNLENKLKKLD